MVRGKAVRAAAFLAALFLTVAAANADVIFRTVTFAWNASSSAGVVGYRIYFGTHSGEYTTSMDVGSSLEADIPNLIDGTTYYFAVAAYDASGQESAPSDEFTHTVSAGVLLNVSARGNVQTGDNVLIAGFIIGGSSRKTVVIRALGPSLAESGVAQALGDPQIEVHDAGRLIAANDNWRDGNPDALVAYNLAPRFDQESAVVMTLPPGAYTAVVSGSGGSTGNALVEVYDVGVPAE
ncbi:MAG TPA: fibronectin type III domain-containing protein [Chthoniobacterales bacterium]